MQVTIGGMPGSGKSVVGKFVADKLGYKFYSIGNIRRELARKKGLTINEYNNLDENTDEESDMFQKHLGETEDDFVLEGRLSFHFVPKSVKIYFDCELEVAAERIFKATRDTEEKGGSPSDTFEKLKERIANDRERYKRYYGIDAYDNSQFDYVIDTTNLTLEEVKAKVLEIVGKEKASL